MSQLKTLEASLRQNSSIETCLLTKDTLDIVKGNECIEIALKHTNVLLI